MSTEELLDVSPGARRPGGPATRRTVAAAVALTLALAVAVAVALVRAGDDAAFAIGGPGVPEPVTGAPEEDWTWEAADTVLVVNSDEERHYVQSADGLLTALDAEGRELWDARGEFGGVIDDEVVVVSDDGGFAALSADDGEELWRRDGVLAPPVTPEGAMFFDEEESSYVLEQQPRTLGLVDSRGDVRWRFPGVQTYSRTADALFVAAGSRLARIDPVTGGEEWRSGLDGDLAEVGDRAVAATERLVAVVTERGVKAYDPGDGEELWAVDREAGDMLVTEASPERVLVATQEAAGDGSAEVSVHDRTGRLGGPVRIDDGYSLFGPWRDGDDFLTIYLSDLVVYDEELHVVADLDGGPTLVEGGVYERVDDRLQYLRFGQEEAEWSLDLPEENASVRAVDGRFLVLHADRVIAYS